MPLAHPLTQPFVLPVSPVVAAAAAAVLVLLVALLTPRRETRAAGAALPLSSWAGALSPALLAARALGLALLLLAILAGRLGADDELENLAPALVVGAGWPLLVLAAALVGPVWRWLDPWDTVARPLARGTADVPAGHVWPAAVVALPWVWYLAAYGDPLGPRSVGAMLALYSVGTVAACLALGRRRWLSGGEPLGLFLSWLALLPRGRLGAWEPPRGVEALLGVLAGGVLFASARRSELWGEWNTAEHATWLATGGLLLSCAAGAALLTGAAAAGRRAVIARAAVPAVAGIVIAVALDRNRLFTSVQLLPGLLADPFGEGWDLLGRPDAGLDPDPLGVRGLLWAQLGVLMAGHVAGAVVVARGAGRRARRPVALALSLLAAASVVAVATH